MAIITDKWLNYGSERYLAGTSFQKLGNFIAAYLNFLLFSLLFY